MKLVKAVEVPCEFQYDSRTLLNVTLKGIIVPDNVAWALAERRNVIVSEVPEETLDSEVVEPTSEPLPETVKETETPIEESPEEIAPEDEVEEIINPEPQEDNV